eukprot:4645636-Pyramimonas_sp.AAC.1
MPVRPRKCMGDSAHSSRQKAGDPSKKLSTLAGRRGEAVAEAKATPKTTRGGSAQSVAPRRAAVFQA